MRGFKNTILDGLDSLTGNLTQKPAQTIGLLISTIFLLWFLPGFLSPELFTGTNIGLSAILSCSGIYLLTAVLFGLSAAILFIFIGNKGWIITAASTVILFLVFLLSAGFMGMERMQPAFFIQGMEHFGISPVTDVLMSAIISFSVLALFTMIVVIPILLYNHLFSMKKSFGTAFFLGLMSFPFIMAAAFVDNFVFAGSQSMNLIISTFITLLQGFILAAIICICLFIPGLLKKADTGEKCRTIQVFGLYISCIIIIWILPGILEPGFFIAGVKPGFAADLGLFAFISDEMKYLGTLLLLPVLFGCSAALLYEIINIGKELLNRGTGSVIALSAGILILISLIPDILAKRSTLSPPFYIPGISSFGYEPLADAVLSLMIFLPQLALAALGIITPVLILKKHFPLKQTVSALIITGLFVFPIMMILTFGTNTEPGLVSVIVLQLQGFVLGAAGSLVIYLLAAIDEKINERI